MAGPLDYASPAQRKGLVAKLDAYSRPRPPRLITELEQAMADNNASTERDRERPAPLRPAPIVAGYQTRQQEIAKLMLEMTYEEFMAMAEAMKVEPRQIHEFAKASIFKPT